MKQKKQHALITCCFTLIEISLGIFFNTTIHLFKYGF